MLYKTKDELLNQIMKILGDVEEPMSATAISKELGYSKIRARVKEALQLLVDDGSVEAIANKSGYNSYILVVQTDEEVVEECDEEQEPADVAPREITEITLPENLNGYDVETLEKNHVKVIFPGEGSEKSVTLEPNERLLVINQNEEYRFVVSAPEQLLQAIATYTSEQGITTYLVTDTATGNAVLDANEVDMKVAIIFLDISIHDKAGN